MGAATAVGVGRRGRAQAGPTRVRGELRGPAARCRARSVHGPHGRWARARSLGDERLERAIGVAYRSETERPSHDFDTDLARQFDLVIHFDRTRTV